MLIRKITWKDDQILGNLSLDLVNHHTDKAYSTIIFAGENGTGKSTILHQLSDFLNGGSLTPFECIEYSVDGHNFVASKYDGTGYSNPPGSWYKRTNLSTGEGTNLARDRSNNPQDAEKDKDDLRHYGCVLSKARSDFNAKPITSSSTSVLDDSKYQVDEKNDFTDLKQLIVDVDIMDAEDYMQRGIKNDGAANPWTTFYPSSRMYRFKEAINGFFEELEYVQVKTVEGEKRIVFKKHNKEIPIDSLSTGEKQIVFRGIYLLRNVNQLDGATVYIDEPELSMHPKWQKKILNYYQDLFRNGDGSLRVQLFFASHSDFLLESALSDAENTLVIVLHDNNGKIESNEIRQPFLLPTITAAEINYKAFGIYSVDYHIALYGEIQARYCSNQYIKTCDDFIVSTPHYNRAVHERITYNGSTTYFSLTTLIRNKIDHPADSPYTYSEEDLKTSTELMREILINTPRINP